MITWENNLSVGNDNIDKQHEYLISIINKLTISINIGICDKNILNELINYAKLHFLLEEKYLLKYKYEETNEHINEHNIFVNYIVDIYNKENIDYIELLLFLESWLINHIKIIDMKYKYLFLPKND